MDVAEGFDVYTNPDDLYTAPIRVHVKDLCRRSTATATPSVADPASAIDNNTPPPQRPSLNQLALAESVL